MTGVLLFYIYISMASLYYLEIIGICLNIKTNMKIDLA